MWNTDLIQIQWYYEKQVTLRGRHIPEVRVEEGSSEGWIWLMYSLHKNEYRIFKPVETTIWTKVDYGRKKKNRGDELNQAIIHLYMEVP
jgi:hypothetical protein